jgi:hypothetical protein
VIGKTKEQLAEELQKGLQDKAKKEACLALLNAL